MNGQFRLGISPAKANLGFCDLSKMVSLQHNPDLVYTFWESMDADARENVLKMTSRCLSVTVFACTNAPGETIEAVCSTLNESSPGVKAWKLADKFSTAAIGGMHRQVWIYKRKPAPLSKNALKTQSLDFSSDLLVSILKKGDDNALPMQLRKREGGSELSAKDLLKVGEALLSAGFSNFEALGNGGFGRVVRVMHKGQPCVLKIGMDVFSSDQDIVNDSLHCEYEIMLQLEQQARETDIRVSAKLLYVFGGASALAKINLGDGRNVSALCMQSCWGDCSSLKMQFRNEFLRDGALSPNCRLFFHKALQLLSLLHEGEIGHNDIKWSNILLLKEWLPGEDPEIVLADFGISVCCYNGTQYVAAPIPNPPARAVSLRAEKVFSKAVPAKKPKPVMPLTPVTKAKLKEAMGSNQRRLLLSAGTHGYRNAVMVKLSNQMSRKALKARSVDKHTPQNVDFGVVCNHDVRSAAAMLCEVMRGKSDGAWAKGNRWI